MRASHGERSVSAHTHSTIISGAMADTGTRRLLDLASSFLLTNHRIRTRFFGREESYCCNLGCERWRRLIGGIYETRWLVETCTAVLKLQPDKYLLSQVHCIQKKSPGMCYLGNGTKKLTSFQNLDLTTHPIMLLFLDRDRLSANIGVPILFTVNKNCIHMFT